MSFGYCSRRREQEKKEVGQMKTQKSLSKGDEPRISAFQTPYAAYSQRDAVYSYKLFRVLNEGSKELRKGAIVTLEAWLEQLERASTANEERPVASGNFREMDRGMTFLQFH